MSCNCKNGGSMDTLLDNKTEEVSVRRKIIKYTLKTLAFILMLVLLPILNLYIIWIMFKMVVMNKNIDIKPLLMAIGEKFMIKDDDDDDDDFNEDDELVMMNVEDITKKSN